MKVTIIAVQAEAAEKIGFRYVLNVRLTDGHHFWLKTQGQFDMWAIFTNSGVKLDWAVIERQLLTDGAWMGEVEAAPREMHVITAIQAAQNKPKD